MRVVSDDEEEQHGSEDGGRAEAAADVPVVTDDEEGWHLGKQAFMQVVATAGSARKEWRTEAQILEDEASIEEITAENKAEIDAGFAAIYKFLDKNATKYPGRMSVVKDAVKTIQVLLLCCPLVFFWLSLVCC